MTRRLAFILFFVSAAAALAGAPAAVDYRKLGSPISDRYNTGTHGSTRAIRFFEQLSDGTVLSGTDTLSVFSPMHRGFVPYPVEGLQGHGISALAAQGSNRLWVGLANDVGIIEWDETGLRRYTSLKADFVRDAGHEPRNFQAIKVTGSRVWFVDSGNAFAWEGGHFTRYPLDDGGNVRVIRPQSDQCWLYVPDRGLLELGETGLRPLLPASALPASVIWMAAGVGTPDLTSSPEGIPDGWFCGTGEAVYVSAQNQWKRLPEISDALSAWKATCGLHWEHGRFAIGTQIGGVVLIDATGHILYRFDHEDALVDNHVLALWSDLPGELWVGTSAGYARVTSPYVLSSFLTRSARGPDLAPRGMAQVAGKLFVATSIGVYEVEPGTGPANPAQLSPLPPPPAPILSLCEFESKLIAGGVNGVWQWDGRWTAIAATKGSVTASERSRIHADRIYLVVDASLQVIEQRQGEWSLTVLESDTRDVPLSLLETADGRLFLSTMSGEILEYRVGEDGSGGLRAERVNLYRLDPSPAGANVRPRLGAVGDNVVAYADAGLFLLDRSAGKFELKVSEYRLLAGAASPVSGSNDSYWMVDRDSNSSPGLIRLTLDSAGAIEIVPLRATLPPVTIRREFPRFAAQMAGDGIAIWVPMAHGLFRFGNDALFPAPLPAAVHLTEVWWSEKPADPEARFRRDQVALHEQNRLPLQSERPIELPPQVKRLRFEFGARPSIKSRHIEMRLLGLEADWATSFSSREFGALQPGEYELQARAIDEFRRAGPALSYRFIVLPPWYRSWAAWVGYVAIAVLALWGAVRWRLRRLERQNATLNQIVEQRTRELELANRNKSDFLATISHEIRNPLNGVTGLVELLKSANLGPSERQLANSLAACARTLRRVFDEVLGFTRLEQGAVSLHAAPFLVSSLLEEAADLFIAEATQRAAPLVVRNHAGQVTLLGDEPKIRTILNNLIANALKYAPGGPIEIDASVEPVEEPLLRLTVEVTDHGPGIPPEEQELIFRKFVRGSSASAERELGAGLGLATCQALAQLLGGSIGVESPAHPSAPAGARGARFFFQIVIPRIAGSTAARPAARETSPPSPMTNSGRALVIEDQEYNQLVARSVTERLNYSATVAGDARRARELFEAGTFALVLVDWDVPGAKGDQLAREIRRTPGGDDSVIIALTAHDTEEVKQRCFEAGMDAFLVKPLTQPMLARTIAQVRAERARRTAPPVTNFSVFEYLGRSAPEETRRAAEEYLRQLESEFADLQRAVAQQDRAGAARVAHRLRAHAAIVSAEVLVAAARKLQETAARDDTSTLGQEFADTTAAMDRLRQELRVYLESPRASARP